MDLNDRLRVGCEIFARRFDEEENLWLGANFALPNISAFDRRGLNARGKVLLEKRACNSRRAGFVTTGGLNDREIR